MGFGFAVNRRGSKANYDILLIQVGSGVDHHARGLWPVDRGESERERGKWADRYPRRRNGTKLYSLDPVALYTLGAIQNTTARRDIRPTPPFGGAQMADSFVPETRLAFWRFCSRLEARHPIHKGPSDANVQRHRMSSHPLLNNPHTQNPYAITWCGNHPWGQAPLA